MLPYFVGALTKIPVATSWVRVTCRRLWAGASLASADLLPSARIWRRYAERPFFPELTEKGMGLIHLSFWAETLIAPLLVLVINFVVRWCLDKEQSTTADLILFLVLFDVVMILRSKEVPKFSIFLDNQDDAIA